ncbi:hypothetical protein A2478_02685 [Candidatus Falkowbacteria bacterium RIFOXYC2_FULL_36_12]|uniref:Septum formation initiator n=1 Tax=Candidatus Falkowbacteria bacterium RIFOXYC2_FULL_36_12 TaxID=1798002 RepID=A0A1F5T0M9_9BACT|nr:MAG: hypothetical protein A2478_02685 [Candidatus Falkowbacteria bacterium RIFOXYC2_FULL_36_12]
MTGSQKGKNNKFLSNLLVLVVFFLVLFISFLVIKEVINKKKLDREIMALKQEIEILNLDQQQFLSSIDKYNSDFFVEQEARSKFNLKKEGEQVAVVKLDDIQKIQTMEGLINEPNVDLQKSNIVKWWEYFFGVKN